VAENFVLSLPVVLSETEAPCWLALIFSDNQRMASKSPESTVITDLETKVITEWAKELAKDVMEKSAKLDDEMVKANTGECVHIKVTPELTQLYYRPQYNADELLQTLKIGEEVCRHVLFPRFKQNLFPRFKHWAWDHKERKELRADQCHASSTCCCIGGRAEEHCQLCTKHFGPWTSAYCKKCRFSYGCPVRAAAEQNGNTGAKAASES